MYKRREVILFTICIQTKVRFKVKKEQEDTF